MSHSKPRWPLIVAATLSTGLLTSCGGDDNDDARGSTTTSQPVAVFDFGGRGTAALGDGWTISHCEGDAPLFCVSDGVEPRGVIEVLDYPIASYDAVEEVLERGGSTAEALRAQAAEFQRVFEEDRPVGCGSGYILERYGPRPVTVAGLPGVIYGFDATFSGRRVERALQFAAIDGDALHILATSAVEDGTCLDDGESIDFTVDELDGIQPRLERLVATSRLP